MATDFPQKGDDLKISLRNSNYPQFDYDFAVGLKENNSEVWRMGGNIRGNEAFEYWTKAREGQDTEGTLAWIKEREAWAARHFGDGAQFADGDLEPNASNIGGIIAQIKWGVIGNLGEQGMKDVVLEMVKKTEGKKDRQLDDATITGLENMRDEHNDEHGDDPTKRVTLGMLETCFERGLAAYQNNPSSVRPAVQSPQQWAYARCRSFLFALRNGRFQGGKHDTDLFPEGHPLRSDDESDERYYDVRPYPNEHAARLVDPDGFDYFRRENDAGGRGVDFIYGIKDNEGTLQSIRFDEQVFSVDEAMTWLDEHDFEPIKFEPAMGDEMETEKRHIVNVQETEDEYIITFAKDHHDDEVVEGGEVMDAELATDEERFLRKDLEKRSYHFEDDRNIDEANRLVRVGVSTEMPVERSFGMEVIDHTKSNMNLEFLNSGRAPLLLDHNMERQIGRIEAVELDESARKLRAVVRFGKSALAEEVFQDVLDGIRQNISVGYRIDGRVHDDDDDVYRVATTPMEISLVSIPADMSDSVGVGRSIPEIISNQTERKIDMSEHDIDIEVVTTEAVKAARKNDSAILALGAKHNERNMAEEAIAKGVSVSEFRGQLLDHIGNKPLEVAAAAVDVKPKEQRQYSLGRMLQAQTTGDWRNAGFERELHDEIQSRVGRSSEGYYIPDFVWSQRAGELATGATGAVGTENVSDNFIPTVHRGDMFIEALRARGVLGGLGATFMSGLTNRIQIPSFTAGANVAFVEELGDVADQSQTDGALNLQPRTLGGFVDISRLMMMEAVPSIEQIVRNDLLSSVADRIEFYAIQGSGASGQPTGLLNTAGIGDVDISAGTDVAALTWQDIIDLAKTVEDANGIVNPNAVGWLTNPKVKSKMAATVRVASTDSVMLLNDPWDNLYGYPIAFSTNVPSNLNPGDGGTDASALVMGDFSSLVIASFGAPSIMVDPYSNSKAGTVRMVLHTEIDTGVRHAASFAKTDEVSTA